MMNDVFSTLRDVLSAVFMLSGSLLAVVSSIGIHRLGSTRARMHATTKPATLGVLLCAVGAATQFVDVSDIAKVLVVVILQLVGAPIGAHMLGRAVGGK
jgi:multicomponent Na+:H+ antiporter subunit G